MPKPRARRATACADRPGPTMPSVAPWTSPAEPAGRLPRPPLARADRGRRLSRAGARRRGSGRRRGRPSSRSARPACCRPGCRGGGARRGRCCRCRPRSWRSARRPGQASSSSASIASVSRQSSPSTSAAAHEQLGRVTAAVGPSPDLDLVLGAPTARARSRGVSRVTKQRAIALSSRRPWPDLPTSKRAGTPAAGSPSLSVVMVTHDSAAAIARSLPAIAAELRSGDELIVCDNGSGDGTRAAVRELAPAAKLIEAGENLGFGGGLQPGGGRSRAAICCSCSTPTRSSRPASATRSSCRSPRAGAGPPGRLSSSTTAAARINTCGSVVHFTGIVVGRAAPGGRGRRLRRSPARSPSPPAPAWRSAARPGISSAASATPTSSTTRTPTSACGCGSPARGRHRAPSGLPTTTTSSTRAPRKWRYLERNRWATIIRTYPTRLLLLLPRR